MQSVLTSSDKAAGSDPAAALVRSHEKRRTVMAMVAASLISLLVWGLVVMLKIH